MKRIGYGIVGLAMVLLGILIIVPFLKSVFPQLDGYVDYPADVIANAQANNADILKNLMLSGTDDTIKQAIDINTQLLAKLAPTDSSVVETKKMVGIQTMALNAMQGDQASIDTITKILTGAKLDPWQPPPPPVIPATIPPEIITFAQGGNAVNVNTTMKWSIYTLKKTIFDINKQQPLSDSNKNLIGLYTLVYAAKMGDLNAVTIVNKILSGGGYPTIVIPPSPQPAPSLSVNTARPSSTLDMMKSACQSLLVDATAPLK